jgi:hypothetical protein
MKKFTIAAFALIMPFLAAAQAQIDTKKVKISDFTQKVTKVVLTGNQFYDACIESDISTKWHVSPYEFCSMAEFEKIKTDDSYYFLITTKGQFRKEAEPGLIFLTLVKGGKNSVKGIDEMLEIVAFPYASAEEPSGREISYLPSILDIIQNYALDSMEKDINAYTGLPNYTMNITRSGNMRLVFSETDLSSEVTPEVKNQFFDEDVLVLEEEDADEYLTKNNENTLVSYVVAPTSAKAGSYCYKMLIDPRANKLYYFRKHKISKKVGAGFLLEDIKRITAPRLDK